MKKNNKIHIDEKVYIPLYMTGEYSSYDLSKIFGCSERTAQKYEQRLRADNKIPARKELDKKRKKTQWKNQEIVEEAKVYIENIHSVMKNYKNFYKDIKFEQKWQKNKNTEDLVLVWSDMHTGMINKHPLTNQITFNQQIQEHELEWLARGVIRFYQLYKPSYNLETLYIFDVGDNITNDRIFEGQKIEITCGVGAQIMKTFLYQKDFIYKMLEYFPNIVLVQVPGNHGRTTSKPISEEATSNFEYLKGQLLIEHFKDNNRVKIIVPDAYTYTMEIYKHKYLLTHGNIVRGATLNSIEKAVKDISTLAYQDFYDLVVIGHFHTALKLQITPETKLLVNGSFIEYDDYAYTKLHKYSTATQWLFNVSKKSAMHNAQEIDLFWKRRI